MAIEKIVYVDGVTIIRAEQLNAWQDELIDLANRKAGALIDTASGAIASFVPDSTVPNLLGVTVDVEPVQDLHGYSNPWPGGGGKNLLVPRLPSFTNAGITMTNNGDGSFTFTGTATSDVNFRIDQTNPSGADDLRSYAAPFSMSMRSTANVGTLFLGGYRNGAWSTISCPVNSSVIQTQNLDNAFAYIRFNSGDEVNATYYPQVESGSSATEWNPYSNECPISGWDAVGIEAAGVNLLELDNASNPNRVAYTYTTETAEKVIATKATGGGSFFAQYKLPVKAGETYTFTLDSYSVGGVAQQTANVYLYADRLWGTSVKGNWNVPTGGAQWIATYTGTVVVGIFSTVAANTAIELSGFQCALGTAKPAFKPYAGNQNTIILGETVYGGKLDVASGADVTNRLAVFDGSTDEQWRLRASGVSCFNIIIPNADRVWAGQLENGLSNYLVARNEAAYYGQKWAFGIDGNSVLVVGAPGIETVADWRSYLSQHPLQIWYTLKSPVHIDTDPVAIAAIAGQTNNVWADAGDVDVQYAADLKTYIDQKIAAAVAAMS